MLLPLFCSAALAGTVCLGAPPPTWRPGLSAQLHAQPTDSAPTSGRAPGIDDPAADNATDPRTAAETAFAAGEAAFVAEDYPSAIAEFERAQALLPHPFTEYNLGLALARGGRDIEAWRVFTQLHEHATSAEQQSDIEGQLAALSPRIARLRVDAPAGQDVTIEGATVAANTELLFTPGPVELRLGSYVKALELRGGELRHLDLRSLESPAPAPLRHQRALTGVLTTAAVFGAGTTGVILGSGFLPASERRPWVMASAGLGGATVALTITALALHLRARRAASGKSSRRKKPPASATASPAS